MRTMRSYSVSDRQSYKLIQQKSASIEKVELHALVKFLIKQRKTLKTIRQTDRQASVYRDSCIDKIENKGLPFQIRQRFNSADNPRPGCSLGASTAKNIVKVENFIL